MNTSFEYRQINEIAQQVVDCVVASKKLDHATIVALSGDLGAGKTTLTQAIARSLGVVENIQSPTFVILKRYALHDTRYTSLIHIDAYRLRSASELEKLNWQEYVSNPDNLIVIEWPEQVAELLPEQTIRINLEHVSDAERKIEIVL